VVAVGGGVTRVQSTGCSSTVEGDTGNPFQASMGHERQRGGRATVVVGGAPMRGVFRARE
jgi:hypothetical protein